MVSFISSCILMIGIFTACLYWVGACFGPRPPEVTEWDERLISIYVVIFFPLFMVLAAVVFKHLWS